MRMPITINLIGARGGQGTSTTAAAVALLAARRGATVELATAELDTMCALLGLATPASDADVIDVVPGLTVRTRPTGTATLIVTDGLPGGAHDDTEGLQLVALRGPCYLSLRRTVDLVRQDAGGVIVVREPGRSVTNRDVAEITGLPVVAETTVSPQVARAIDAGVLTTTITRRSEFAALDRWLDTLDLDDLQASSTVLRPPDSVPPSAVRFARSSECTDLPVARSATGRADAVVLFSVRGAHSGGDVECRQVGCGRGRVLRRRGRDFRGGLLLGTR